ncbi:MAG: Acetolactate synthase large subunit [Alphaproteobacteria bacterium MarineAlpha10_Bin3]|jgi:acetolactate synthase-1/2/3 large subunit|nr:MAG: Acetolactate synthase large subunit [Alphaproteobacteria bacterium MarineAlpha10_Bin3]PPR71589.1 MAG: Acetolactate synthase large subunit [Alphaproteobacteria bacterium MarineAlpha4_Bin1]
MSAPTDDNITRNMNGGEALAEMLQAHGVELMCGMGGFQLLPFYEAVRGLGLNHNLINDERCGVFIADAYARVTGKPGVCDATLGPGATNLVTGLVESLNAGVPLVVLTGDANREHAWKNMTQECRQVDILTPAVKELIRIEDGRRIPELVRRAFAVATSGRPGPVLLDIPEDVCHGTYDFTAEDFWIDPQSTAIPNRRARPAADDIARAAALLAKAERPLLLVGGGIHLSQAYDALADFAEALNIPVAHTMSGKGGLACIHPLSAGIFGRYTRIANDLIASSDCLMAVGCKLGEIATKRFQLLPGGTPLIQLDVLAEELGRTTRIDVGLCGDAGEGLRALLAELSDSAQRQHVARADYVAELPVRMKAWLDEAAERLHSKERPINVARMIHELNNVMPAKSVLVADGGFSGHWTGLLYDTKIAGRSYVADRGLASIGYGLPGAIGAQLGAPDRPVVGMTGDGGFNMVIGELETARRMKAGVTILVVNNAASGYVKALQHAMYGDGNYQSSDLMEMNYADVAQCFGCQGIRIEDPDDLAGAIRTGLAETTRPTVIDVVVTRDPAKMLPAIDSRVLKVEKGDRPI